MALHQWQRLICIDLDKLAKESPCPEQELREVKELLRVALDEHATRGAELDLDHAQIEESFKKICVKVEQWSAWTEKAKQNHDLHLQDIAMERQSECAFLQQALQELLNASSDHRKVIAGQKNAINAKLAEVKRALAELPFMRRA